MNSVARLPVSSETNTFWPCPEVLTHLHEALQQVCNRIASQHSLSLEWEGAVLADQIRAQIVCDSSNYACLGLCALMQINGRIVLKVLYSGTDGTQAYTLARQLADFPRGTDVPLDNGELTLGTSRIGRSSPGNELPSINVTIPFYALTQSTNL